MSNVFSRRGFLGGAAASVIATAACANAPERSAFPKARPLGGRAGTAPEADALIAAAKLGGAVGYVVADARTGRQLESLKPGLPMPPASVMKALTTVYALDTLGPDYRFSTRLLATGPVSGGRLNGNLVLVGGGDPTLDTEDLAEMAAQLKASGVSEVSGQFLYWDGSLPGIRSIDPDQPEHVGYSPAISGLNLNFNRVYFEWKRQGNSYATSMDARSNKRRPTVSSARMTIENRSSPVYTFRNTADAERWTVARGALGKGGGRWLPVRNPGRYTAEVFRVLARAQGISLGVGRATANLPAGQTLVAVQSPSLPAVAEDMLEYSTNLTAEVLGLRCSGKSSLRASATEMQAHLRARFGLTTARLMDHSGLGTGSRISAEDMVRLMVGSGPGGALRPLLKNIPIRDEKGRPIKDYPVKVNAKTGTLNFVSTLSGFAQVPGGRVLAFAILTGDPERRAKYMGSDDEAPQGAASWNRRSKALQQALLQRWGKVHSA